MAKSKSGSKSGSGTINDKAFLKRTDRPLKNSTDAAGTGNQKQAFPKAGKMGGLSKKRSK